MEATRVEAKYLDDIKFLFGGMRKGMFVNDHCNWYIVQFIMHKTNMKNGWYGEHRRSLV
jgi:hypothetical protein